MTGDYWSALYDAAVYRRIGFLQEDAARRLITEPVKSEVQYDDLALQEILLAGCPTVGVRTKASFVRTSETGVVVRRRLFRVLGPVICPSRATLSTRHCLAFWAKTLDCLSVSRWLG